MSNEARHRVHPPILARARELRRPQTPAEARVWTYLHDRQLGGAKFRRPHPVGPYIADFYCAAARLVVEVDGDSHADQVEYDAARTAWLEAAGHRVLRVTNRDVQDFLEGVLYAIQAACAEAGAAEPPKL